MEEEDDQKELQLLPTPQSMMPTSPRIAPWPPDPSKRHRANMSDDPFEGPSLDLQLSISLRPIRSSQGSIRDHNDLKPETSSVEALKWEAAEQIRLAAMEKAYAERVRELTRREMELAQSEFARARLLWERAHEEVEKAERMKERATRRIDSSCMEITCQACSQRFRP